VPLFFRLTLFLLTLSGMTAMATVGPSGRGVASIQAELRFAPTEPNLAQAHGKLQTAQSNITELEDGPQGEKIPVANVICGHDGDDQVEAEFGLTLVAVQFATSSANAGHESPKLSHPPCAGFPTGPPLA
jgi:hypothetical protein